MKRIYALIGGLIILASLAACGPSPEQIATMTASAWTPTPLPPTATPTPTPARIDLTVTIADETGTSIAGASIVFPESGNGSPVLMDDQGQYSWTNLGSEAVSLTVSAQGYLDADLITTIQRGSNEIKVTLQRDPMGILPAEACATGQKVLYIEDFQDGQAQGWNFISPGINGDMPNGWSVIDEDGNKILSHGNAPQPTNDELQGFTFDNFVWHLKYKVTGKDGNMFFIWRISHEGDTSKWYVVVVGAQDKPWMVRFFHTPTGPNPMNTAQSSIRLQEGQWYNFDVVYFDGTHQVWLDGKKIMEYKDPQPYPAGSVGFETHLDQSKVSQFFLDDLRICELTAPYEPPP
ncbi:MAG: family 16 glycoside hydrolase [Armatimonadota bacterium]